jgi:hypothetical protein
MAHHPGQLAKGGRPRVSSDEGPEGHPGILPNRHRVLIAIAVLTVMSILAWPLIKLWFPDW